MAKYDYTRLKTFCDLKNITLVGRDYSKERINAHTKIEFNCVELDCVSTHIKNMESFITGAGAYCRKHELQHRAASQITNNIIRKVPYNRSFASHERAIYWSTQNGIIKPSDVYKSTDDKYWFDCPECNHTFDSNLSSITKGVWCGYCLSRRLCEDNDCQKCYEKSFASHEKSIHWSNQNERTSRQVCKSSNDEFKFDCNICKHTFVTTLNHITHGDQWCNYCASRILCDDLKCQIFASNPISKCWVQEKNGKIKPRDVHKSIADCFWFKCDKCEHELYKSLNGISSKDDGCSYCHHLTLCDNTECQKCYEKSFASHETAIHWSKKNNNINPRNIFKHTLDAYLFDCDKCKHTFLKAISNITKTDIKGSWCNYCSNHNICDNIDCILCFDKSFASHIKSVYWNKEKNAKIKPRNVLKYTHDKYWFNCDKCERLFDSALYNVTGGKWCPYCVNKTEQKLYDILIQHYLQLKQQFKVEWCKNKTYLPFDFVLEEYKIIIELDGTQHFEQVSNWTSPEETHLNDVYKMKCANENGYSVIRLLQTDVFYDTYDWLTELRQHIEKIILEQRVQNMYMCKDNEYAIFTT